MTRKLYEVRRRLPGERVYEAGEVVDGTDWPHGRAEMLVTQRYLARLPDGLAARHPLPVPAPVLTPEPVAAAPRGRKE